MLKMAEPLSVFHKASSSQLYVQVTSISDSKDGTRKLLGFDVISETLRATNLGSLEMNSSVNFERWVLLFLGRTGAAVSLSCGI